MNIERFEDIIAWQKAKELSLEVYRLFGDSKDFGFRDQIQRAAISIMNNIAEGFERESDKDFKRFLYIAKGSSGELRSMLTVAKELDYITGEQYDDLYKKSVEISRLLSGFIRKI
jgi:four helix bundle protein